MVKVALLGSHIRLGRVAQLTYSAIFGNGQTPSPELLPMPPPPPQAEEARLITAIQAGTKPQDLRHDFLKTIKAAGRQARGVGAALWLPQLPAPTLRLAAWRRQDEVHLESDMHDWLDRYARLLA